MSINYNISFRNYFFKKEKQSFIKVQIDKMKTHINNTTAQSLKNDILSHTMFQNHQQTLHSGAVKPIVVTKHKEEIKIVK